ncbi:hypothetical protein PAHAL_3G299400 [Panicum hallii]|uniref:Uncharacterized protein n=1 Tax=Panicum hallii TaxID=206008 RepID=A0A2T8KJX4_9POAL|nr:hypothetical protein PAHAL_3G299400 [Panicum hallii]
MRGACLRMAFPARGARRRAGKEEKHNIIPFVQSNYWITQWARIILFHYYLLTFSLCATESIISTRMEKLAEEWWQEN